MTAKPDPALPWPIDYDAGVLEVAGTENLRLKAYPCQAGRWTCGWGETEGVGPNTAWTKEYADQRFCDSLTERTRDVLAACTVEPTKYQLASLVSFAYNYGHWRTSTVLKCHNRGDFQGAARAFDLVNKFTNPATGKLEVSNGLTARRKREAALYMRPSDDAPHAMPQVVAPESAPLAGQISVGGSATGATGLVLAAAQFKEQLGPVGELMTSVKSFMAELNVPPDWVLPLLLMGVGALVVYWRLKQRREGWA